MKENIYTIPINEVFDMDCECPICEFVKNEELKSDSNNDKLSDYHTRLICDGKILYWTGARVVKCTSYESINKNNDYDGDGIINGEEIEVIEGSNGRIYVKEYSDMTLNDSDDDGIDDYDEMMNDTDPLIKDIKIGDMNYLLNNDLYNSSILSEDYLNDNWLHFQIVAGNALLNNNFVYVSDYKLAITNFLTIYLYDLTEEEILNIGKENMLEDIYEKYGILIDLSSEIFSTVEEISDEYEEYNYLYTNMLEYVEAMETAYQNVKNVEKIAEIEGFVEFTDLYRDKFVSDYLYNKYYSDKFAKILQKYPLARFNNIVMKIPNGIRKFMSYGNSGLEFFIFAGFTRNDEMRYALSEIEKDINQKSDDNLSIIYDVYERASEDTLEFWITSAKAKLGAYGFAIDVGMGIGNLLFNTSEMCEKSINDIVYGDLAVNISELVNKDYSKDGEFFYKIGNYDAKKIQLLSQLRIMGEKSFVELYSAKSGLVKIIDSIIGYSENDVKKAIDYKINNITDICNNLKLKIYNYAQE